MRRAHKTDSNQTQIVAVLRQIGCTVAVTSALGGGFPDIVVGRNGRNYLLEIKAEQAGRLTAEEDIFRNTWKGQYAVVHDLETALAAVGAQLQ